MLEVVVLFCDYTHHCFVLVCEVNWLVISLIFSPIFMKFMVILHRLSCWPSFKHMTYKKSVSGAPKCFRE